MNSRIHKIRDNFDEKPLKLRLLITFAAILVMLFTFDFLWISPVLKESTQVERKIVQTQKNIQQLADSLALVNQGVYDRKNNPAFVELGQVKEQLEKVKQQLHEKTISLIKPEEMAGVLQEIIAGSQKLTLLSMNKMSPQAMFQQEDTQDIQMYRHVFEVVFTGEYIDTMQFIEELEKLPKKLNFDSLDYQVDEYPLSIITLTLSTLSFNRKWIGG